MSILRVNISKTKYCILYNGMLTDKSLPGVLKVNVSFSAFKNKVRNLYKKILVNIDAERHFDWILF